MKPVQTETHWRCKRCGMLLGVERSGRMHLKYKKAQFVVQGAVLAVCRYCSEINERRTPPSARGGTISSTTVLDEPPSAS